VGALRSQRLQALVPLNSEFLVIVKNIEPKGLKLHYNKPKRVSKFSYLMIWDLNSQQPNCISCYRDRGSVFGEIQHFVYNGIGGLAIPQNWAFS
jgi:hypothetical protein